MMKYFSAGSSRGDGGDRQIRNTSNNYNESIGPKIYTKQYTRKPPGWPRN